MDSGPAERKMYDGERQTCNVAFKVAAQPSIGRQFRALFRKNIYVMIRDYSPTINTILTPIYYLVILIFLNSATTKTHEHFSVNTLPYLTNGTCTVDSIPECIHLAYTNSSPVDPILNQLNTFFQASEPNPVIFQNFPTDQAIVDRYNENPKAVVVGIDFKNISVDFITQGGGTTQYQLLVNHTSFYKNFFDSRFLTAQAYLDRALVNLRRSRNNLTLFSSPLPTRGSDITKDAKDAAGLPYIGYSEFPGKFTAGLTLVNAFYIIFCFQPAWLTILIWLAQDNETRIKANMLSMGLSPTVYQLSIWITQASIGLPITILMTTLVYAGKIFSRTSWFLIFILFFFFYLSATSLGILVGVFFKSSPSKASTVSFAITIAGLVAYGLCLAFFYGNNKNPDPGSERAVFLVSPIAFARSIGFISDMEAAGRGVTSTNLADSPILSALYMMVIDAVIYITAALYLDRLFPGIDCHPLPWNFPFQPTFWGFNKSAQSIREKTYNLSRSPTALSDGLSEDHENLDNIEVVDFTSIPTEDRGAITVRRLHKQFRIPGTGLFSKSTIKKAVNGLSFQVHRNEIFGLLGHNGAGKSTTISMLIGSLLPDSGDVLVEGYRLPSTSNLRKDMDLSALSAVHLLLGVCPQHDVLFEHLTAVETLRLYADIRGVVASELDSDNLNSGPSLDAYIDHLLTDVHLIEKRNQRVWTFSGGMKRKLSVAIAFLGDPKVILLDEPTTGMDVYTRKQIWQLIQDSKRNRAIILTTHSMEEADALGDRVAIMSKGKLQALGTSLFLKNRFGIGYRLHAEKKSDVAWDPTRLSEIIRSEFPDSEIIEDSTQGITYQIPIKHHTLDQTQQQTREAGTARFPELFEKLRVAMGDGSVPVASVGLSLTTLEEVFLALQEQDEQTDAGTSTESPHASRASTDVKMVENVNRPSV